MAADKLPRVKKSCLHPALLIIIIFLMWETVFVRNTFSKSLKLNGDIFSFFPNMLGRTGISAAPSFPAAGGSSGSQRGWRLCPDPLAVPSPRAGYREKLGEGTGPDSGKECRAPCGRSEPCHIASWAQVAGGLGRASSNLCGWWHFRLPGPSQSGTGPAS